VNVRIVFMGTPAFAVPSLRSLVKQGYDIPAVYTRPAQPAGRGRMLRPSAVREAAEELRLPVYEIASLVAEERVEQLRRLRPDVIVVAAFAHLIPPGVLALPERGCLNVHPSLLPKYRGPSPVAESLRAGDDVTGVTIMLMDEGLDTGPIVNQASVPIADSDTTGSLTHSLALLGADLLCSTIEGWVRGEMASRPQDPSMATYSRKVTADAGRLDWSEPADALWRKVRAYHPWPVCYTLWNGKRLRIHSAHPVAATQCAPVGKVVRLGENGRSIGVVAGRGTLLLDSVQLEGKRRVSVEEFARGQSKFIDSVLIS